MYICPIFVLFLSLFVGCSEQPTSPSYTSQIICGRTQAPLYRAKVPMHWSRQDPHPEALADTRNGLCEFHLIDKEGLVRVVVHNFPYEKREQSIPPEAQVARWKRQFSSLDTIASSATPDGRGGFVGLFFEGSGILNSQETTVLAWAMQLAPEHYSKLNKDQPELWADYTIKATGPSDLVGKHREEIILFAHSFELITELPIYE